MLTLLVANLPSVVTSDLGTSTQCTGIAHCSGGSLGSKTPRFVQRSLAQEQKVQWDNGHTILPSQWRHEHFRQP